MWALSWRTGQATGIAEGTSKNSSWKSSWSHLSIPPHGTMKTLLIILHYSNFLHAWSVWSPQFKACVICVAFLGSDFDFVPPAALWVGKAKVWPLLMVPRAMVSLAAALERHMSPLQFTHLYWLLTKGAVSQSLKFSLWMQLLVTGSIRWEKIKGEL